jgi:uncharacterized membrane protein
VWSVGWAPSDDFAGWPFRIALLLGAAAVVLLFVELRRGERLGPAIAASGVCAVVLLVLAAVRPARVRVRGTLVGPRVVVLVDQSRRLLLDAGGRTRRQIALGSARALVERFQAARVSTLGFGEGAPRPLAPGAADAADLGADSDLAAALGALAQGGGERPEAIVVVSDGRLSRPGADADAAALRHAVGTLGVPVHSVAVAREAPRDAAIRSVRTAGAAVAHQPLGLLIEVACTGGLACDSLPVSVRELRHGVPPATLRSGAVKIEDGVGSIELPVTLERAGTRVVEIAIDAPDGDRIQDNDVRRIAFSVTRDRVRLLHVAGRPTYDVRALRTWLKGDASVDLVAFFILRTDFSETETEDDSELALIPFPVDELFSEHLPSFDAVVLQDIHAVRYKLSAHLERLASYVESGGGLVLVGGKDAFAAGGYAGTALDRVVPVAMSEAAEPFEGADFVPAWTRAGRAAPVTRALRDLFGDRLPELGGANVLGEPREGALVLWEHPRHLVGERRMPVLALGEMRDGRSIALGVDTSFRLAFSEIGAEAAGRGHGALWDGLLGWLMRDPRFEAARVELERSCVAGEPVRLRLVPLPGAEGPLEVRIERLGSTALAPIVKKLEAPASGATRIDLGALEPGGWSVLVRIGAAPPTRLDFACERGGAAWSDVRPDVERLERIAGVTGGRVVAPDQVAKLPLPPPAEIAAERHLTPLLPAWLWSLAAALSLGAHWVLRRRGGLV